MFITLNPFLHPFHFTNVTILVKNRQYHFSDQIYAKILFSVQNGTNEHFHKIWHI